MKASNKFEKLIMDTILDPELSEDEVLAKLEEFRRQDAPAVDSILGDFYSLQRKGDPVADLPNIESPD